MNTEVARKKHMVLINGIVASECGLCDVSFSVNDGWAIIPDRVNFDTGVISFRKITGKIDVVADWVF